MDPYSRTERTRAMYAVLLLLIEQWPMLHQLKNTKCGVCFFVTVDICECHLRSSEMVRPIYGLLFTRSRVALFKL